MAQKKIQAAQVDPSIGGATPDADTSTKGKIQLSGDLGGTAASPTVPGLATKANTTHTHTAADIATGTIALARLGSGGTPSTTTFLRGDNTWAVPPTGTGGGTTYADPVIIVAAAGASAAWKAVADYTCTGTADNTVIQSAITAAKTDGTRIVLSPGTFNLAASLTIAGTDNPDAGYVISIRGQGAAQTILSCAANVDGIVLSNCCRVNLEDFQVQITGTGNGIRSTGAGTTYMRSFWMSSFRNLYFVGPWSSAHTGWGMKLGSPFRSTFENIEMGGVRNGLQCFTESAAFNPGDCIFSRMFIEIAGGTGVAYHLRGAVNADCTMNQMLFQMCEAICDGSAGTTGVLLDGTGTGSADWNTFIAINLEQFAILIDVENGGGNTFDCNYIEARPTAGTVFKCGANAGFNRFSSRNIYSSTAQTLINDLNSTGTGNHFEHILMFADTGSTMTVTKAASTVVLHNAVKGGGTVPSTFLS